MSGLIYETDFGEKVKGQYSGGARQSFKSLAACWASRREDECERMERGVVEIE